MTLHRLIQDRRTIHDYRPGEELPQKALERAIEAAVAAPNHRMTEPWRFVRVGPDTRPRLVAIAEDIKSQGGAAPLHEGARDKLRAKMLNPSELVVVCQTVHEDPKIEREDYAAVACAVQNAMLSLWSEGIGSKWSTGAVITDARTYALLEVDSKGETIVGFLWIGYPARDGAPKARRRRSFDEVLRRLP